MKMEARDTIPLQNQILPEELQPPYLQITISEVGKGAAA